MGIPRLHLPNIPRNMAKMNRAAGLKHGTRLKNPFGHMSGSIAASQKRALSKAPKPKKFFS